MIQSDQWETPDDLYNKLDNEFHFDFDLCAAEHNHKVDAWCDNIEEAVLTNNVAQYFNSFWMNPPYSRGNIEHCMAMLDTLRMDKYFEGTIVTLTRFDPSTDWFKKYVDGVANEVRMLAHRVKFKGAKDSYNFPCCVAVYEGWNTSDTYYHIWSWK